MDRPRPVLLGDGTPFFDGLTGAPVDLDGAPSVTEGVDVTHLRYRVRYPCAMSYADVNGLSLFYEEQGSGQSPLYARCAQVAPRSEDWPVLIGKTSELLKVDYDWGDAVAALEAQTMLVFADADSVRPAHIVEFFGLLGGGLRDAGWDMSAQPTSRVAILPGTTHYDVLQSPLLVPPSQGSSAR